MIEIFEKNMQRYSKENPGLIKPKKIYLPNLNVAYECSPEYFPMIFEPVSQKDLPLFRRNFEEQLRKLGRLYFWSYETPEREFDAKIDTYKVKTDKPVQNPQTLAVYCHTVSEDEFLRDFLPRATELSMLVDTQNPKQDSIQELEEKIDKYLNGNFNISYKNFKNSELSGLKGKYDYKPIYERRIDFSAYSLIYLGALASMQISPENFFLHLRKKRIYPIKKSFEQPILSFIEHLLVQAQEQQD